MSGLGPTRAAFVVASLGLWGCRAPGPAEPAPPSQASPASASARFQGVEPARGSAWLDAPAHVVSSPNDTALVSAPLGARVQKLRVYPGQTVREGDALVDVVMPELLRAAGALRSADLRLASWQERRAILAPLVEKGLARPAELSDIDANIASVRGDRESARATLRAAGELDARAGALLDGQGVVSLRAPLGGVVVSVTAKVGEFREPNSGALVELVSPDADPRVEARFAAAPPPGMRFEWVEAGRSMPLVLDALSPHADERDGSRVAWFHVEGADASVGLVAGALGRVHMVVRDDWVVVPTQALREEHGETTVEVREAAGTRRVQVKLIQRSDTEALIEGLRAEAQIAVGARGEGDSSP